MKKVRLVPTCRIPESFAHKYKLYQLEFVIYFLNITAKTVSPTIKDLWWEMYAKFENLFQYWMAVFKAFVEYVELIMCSSY